MCTDVLMNLHIGVCCGVLTLRPDDRGALHIFDNQLFCFFSDVSFNVKFFRCVWFYHKSSRVVLIIKKLSYNQRALAPAL